MRRGEPAVAWLRRYRASAVSLKHPGRWSAPALTYLRYDPDPISVPAIRRADPQRALHVSAARPRDEVTHQFIASEETVAR